MIFSRYLRLQHVILEGDALEVVQTLKSKRRSWSWYGQLIEYAKTVLDNMQSWYVGHIKREANLAAYHLTKAAMH